MESGGCAAQSCLTWVSADSSGESLGRPALVGSGGMWGSQEVGACGPQCSIGAAGRVTSHGKRVRSSSLGRFEEPLANLLNEQHRTVKEQLEQLKLRKASGRQVPEAERAQPLVEKVRQTLTLDPAQRGRLQQQMQQVRSTSAGSGRGVGGWAVRGWGVPGRHRASSLPRSDHQEPVSRCPLKSHGPRIFTASRTLTGHRLGVLVGGRHANARGDPHTPGLHVSESSVSHSEFHSLACWRSSSVSPSGLKLNFLFLSFGSGGADLRNSHQDTVPVSSCLWKVKRAVVSQTSW